MQRTAPGTRRYFYEYLFHQAIEGVKADKGRPDAVMVSAARRMRSDLDAALAARGTTIDQARVNDLLGSVNEVLGAGVADYSPMFPTGTTADEAYSRLYQGYLSMIEAPRDQAGPRLPISPYDPRWAGRSTVKSLGSELSYVLDADVEQLAGGSPERLPRVINDALRLHRVEDGRAAEVGRALTFDDQTGMSELMSRMTREEYQEVRGWVADGARLANGRFDASRTMTPQAIARSAAILDELRDQGVPYEVVRDREPGQVAARIQGTKVQVRLTDTRANEEYVGRVWDDGMSVYYTTNHMDSGTNRLVGYTPTTAEVVNLMRVAQGLPVQRSDGQGMVGQRGTHQRLTRRGAEQMQDSYYSKSAGKGRPGSGLAHMAAVGPLRINGRIPSVGAQVFVRRDAVARSNSSTWFGDAEAGESYLRERVASARENIVAGIDVDRIIAEFEDNEEAARAGEHSPAFSGDPELAAVQRAYWDVLRGAQETLLRPGATAEEFDEATAVLAELDLGPEQRRVTMDMAAGSLAYTGTPAEKVRAHLAEVPDRMVGTFEAREVVDDEGVHHLKRFDPVRVAKYMTSEHGTWRNTSDVVAALRAADISPEELMGEGFGARSVKDRLVRFDEATAFDVADIPEDSLVRQMGEVARDSLERAGIEVSSLRADGNGIIAWRGQRVGRNGAPLEEEISGQVGQVFEQGELGEVITRFGSGQDYLLVPGYEARIAAQRPGEDLSVEERTRLRGYRQQLAEAVRYQVAQDVVVARTVTGDPTSINGVYRRLYDERLPVDFLERADERGLDRGWSEAVLDTLSRRVRYPDQMGDTFYQSWRRDSGAQMGDPADDNHFDALVLSGGRNMAVLSAEQRGYFDPDMTNASKMGTTFYLTEGASVDPETGAIVPSADPDDRAPLMKHPEARFMAFNSWDRRQMISSMLLHATGVTAPEKVLMSDVLKGWTADDGRVVSKDYAERNQMLASDGTMRPLQVGDKDSDLHGNKGVIGMIIDPGMDDAEAEAQGVLEAVKLFRQNEGLSVVMSPFSGISRMNGGTAREMMEGAQDAVLPDGTVVPGGIGTMRFIITNKDVEGGTRHYDEEAQREGRGRRASAQLGWGLGSVGADAVMAEFYGPNGAGASNLREMLITMGMDMAPDGTLLPSQHPATAQERALMEMPELAVTERGTLDSARMRREFAAMITDRGGDMEIPFPLSFPHDNGLTPATDRGTWRLPVLSSHLRSGTELDDGGSTSHDYTNQYQAIHDHACAWRYAREQLEREDLTDKRRADLQARMAAAPGRAQGAFDMITSSLEARHFSGKRNIFKEQVMSARLPNSATAVWTADPRLDLDQVGMGPALAQGLGVGDDDHVLVWRDPVLRDSGVRYLRVKTDERLTGVAINPVMDKGFDGDFDGDSVGIAVLHSERAKQQARELLSVEANLLDQGSLDDEGYHPLNMQNSLDIKVSQHFDPQLRERFADLRQRANDDLVDLQEGTIERREFLERSREVLDGLNAYYRDALDPSVPGRAATLRFGSAADHVASMQEACIDTGAKGSPGKLRAYGQFFGVDEQGRDLERPWSQRDPQAARQADEGTQVAVTVKTAVGIAGTYSQRGVKALRNEELKSVLELTYPVTQSLLQAKHDPTEAMHKYDMLMGPGRSLWKGRLMQQVAGPDGQPTWAAARDAKGQEQQATPEQWQEQFIEMYQSDHGLNVRINPDDVRRVALALTDPATGRMVDIEARQVARDLAPKGSTMDRLAYGGTFADVQAAAARGEELYEGTKNGAFAPYAIRNNQRALREHEEAFERRADDTRGVPAPEITAITARDVLDRSNERFAAKGAARRSELARAVRGPRRPEVETVIDAEGAPVHGDDDYYSL